MPKWQTILDWLGNRTSQDQIESATMAAEDAVYACQWMELARYAMASYVTSAIQLCEIHFYEGGKLTDGREDDWLWNVSPNPNQSRSIFISSLLEKLLVTDGEALVVPVRSGAHTSLYVAESFGRTPVPGAADIFSPIVIEGSADVAGRAYSADEVYYFDARGFDGGWRDLMDNTTNMYDWVAEVIFQATADRNGRKWYMKMDQPMAGTPEEAERVRKQLRESVMPFVRGTTAVIPLFRGQSLERASLDSGRFSGMNAKDIAAIRADMFNLVASCFRMPASMLQGNVNNFDQVFNSFLTFAVDPVARMLSEEITRKHATRAQWSKGKRAIVDTHHIRHVDLFDVADKIEKLVGSSIDCPNEIRGFTGQDPIPEPWADEYQMTKNHEAQGQGVNTQ